MKKYSFILLAALLILGFAACKNDKPGDDLVDPTPADTVTPTPAEPQPATSPAVKGSFARKHLIEQFTGEDCGYCPAGMGYIAEAIEGNEEKYVWVANHYGFGTDEYTIKESETIGKKFKVSGAPMVMFDRTKYTYDTSEGKVRVGHPGYLENVIGNVDSETSYASVNIAREYNAGTKALKVKVSGKCEAENVQKLLLTVCVKESGTIGAQKDYYNSWEGWKEFVHTKTLRGFMTDALGDTAVIKNGAYELEFEYTLDSKWNAENSTVVAYLTYPGKNYPVLNAEQVAVVEGTTGGEDIVAHGETLKPVADYYPEGSAPKVYEKYTVYAQQGSGQNTLVLLSSGASVTVSGYAATPCMLLYFVTGGATKVPNGTYTIDGTGATGTVIAGSRNDEKIAYEGSLFCYYYTPYLQQGKIYALSTWYIAAGTVTVTDDGITVNATTKRGYPVTGTTSTTTSAPIRRITEVPMLMDGLK